jgi:hypothetical protein
MCKKKLFKNKIIIFEIKFFKFLRINLLFYMKLIIKIIINYLGLRFLNFMLCIRNIFNNYRRINTNLHLLLNFKNEIILYFFIVYYTTKYMRDFID